MKEEEAPMSNDLTTPVADRRDAVIRETEAAIVYRCRKGA